MKKDYKEGDILTQYGVEYICMGNGCRENPIRKMKNIPHEVKLYPMENGVEINTDSDFCILDGTESYWTYWMTLGQYKKLFPFEHKRGDILNQDGVDYIFMGRGDWNNPIRKKYNIPERFGLFETGPSGTIYVCTDYNETYHRDTHGISSGLTYWMKKEDYDKHFTKEEPKKKYMILVPRGDTLHVYHYQEGDFDTSLDGGDIKHITNDLCGAIILEGDVLPRHNYKNVVGYVMKTVKQFVVE